MHSPYLNSEYGYAHSGRVKEVEADPGYHHAVVHYVVLVGSASIELLNAEKAGEQYACNHSLERIGHIRETLDELPDE